jgi:Ca2+-binding EF-hand superfamily protein
MLSASTQGEHMKIVAAMTAAGLAAASFLVLAGPSGHDGGREGMAARLKAADANGDGLISKAEAQAALPMIARHFDEIDANKDGFVTGDELRAFHQQHRAQRRAEHFKQIDADGDGRVSKAEAQAKAPRLFAHFDQVDANGDGFLTPEELKAAHGRHQAHGPK